MKQNFFRVSAFAIVLLLCIALFFAGNYAVYILAYIFSFIFLIFYTILIPATISYKIVEIMIYALILAAQIVFDALVLRVLLDGAAKVYFLGNLIGILIIFTPMLVKHFVFSIDLNKNGAHKYEKKE